MKALVVTARNTGDLLAGCVVDFEIDCGSILLFFFPQFIEFMEANTELAQTLFFEFPEQAIASLGPLEYESLNALSELGFRFSLDHVTSLDIDFETLAEIGFRFVKVDAQTMLEAEAGDGARVHPVDLSKLANNNDITLFTFTFFLTFNIQIFLYFLYETL